MSETTREVLDSYQKVFSGDCYKNMGKLDSQKWNFNENQGTIYQRIIKLSNK